MGLVISIIVILIAGAYGFWRWNTQATVIQVNDGLPKNFPLTGFSHQNLEVLLFRFVDDEGLVNYDLWHQDKNALKQLNEYLAAVAKYSPENAPKKFEHKNDRLAYWVYSYNALVIKSILDNWPLSSVTDLAAPVEIIRGLGFFYKRKFILGGKEYSLYQIENGKIFDGESDPRVHFVLNCGSGSCPVLRPQLPVGEALEPFLKQAAKTFVSDTKNIFVNHQEKKIYLSMIFKWYQDDFIRVVSEKNIKATLIDYIKSIGDEALVTQLTQASGYAIEFIEYDWSVNKSGETH